MRVTCQSPPPCLFIKDNLASEENGLQHAAGMTQHAPPSFLWGVWERMHPELLWPLGWLLVQSFLHLSSEPHLSSIADLS